MQDAQEMVARDKEYKSESGPGSEATLDLTKGVAHVVRCSIHPRYKGLRKPHGAVHCSECEKLFAWKRAAGVREKRKKTKDE